MEYSLQGADYIELIKLLKLLRIASSGGEAKVLVDSDEVTLNGQQETRYRAKLRQGDVVKVMGKEVRIVE